MAARACAGGVTWAVWPLHQADCLGGFQRKCQVMEFSRKSVVLDQLRLVSRPRSKASRQERLSSEAHRRAGAAFAALPDALLFDCDGVLVDTERDGHRISFNETFAEKGLDVEWGVELYGELLKIGGGKERMTHYFNKVGWPAAAPTDPAERKSFIAGLHSRKTVLFMDLIEMGSLPLRPGVTRLIDEALVAGLKVAVCSTSNEKAVSAIVRVLLGPDRAASITIFAGDIVAKKKPDPAIYLLASTTLGIAPERCVVIEDSGIGLAAAKAAGMKCIVTKSGYTAEEDLAAADAVFENIGDDSNPNFGLEFCGNLIQLTPSPL